MVRNRFVVASLMILGAVWGTAKAGEAPAPQPKEDVPPDGGDIKGRGVEDDLFRRALTAQLAGEKQIKLVQDARTSIKVTFDLLNSAKQEAESAYAKAQCNPTKAEIGKLTREEEIIWIDFGKKLMNLQVEGRSAVSHGIRVISGFEATVDELQDYRDSLAPEDARRKRAEELETEVIALAKELVNEVDRLDGNVEGISGAITEVLGMIDYLGRVKLAVENGKELLKQMKELNDELERFLSEITARLGAANRS